MRLNIYKVTFGHFFCLFWLSFISRPIHLFNASFVFQTYQNRFNKKTTLRKNLAVTINYFCYGHTSLKRERVFH